jgi:cyclic-di-GMP phosphodiesterase TipF (flagellum assembly factor)
MQRGFLAVVAAIVVCALCYLALSAAARNGESVTDIVLMTCGATLALAAIGAIFAVRAFIRASAVQRDLATFSRSVDAALRELSARGHRETASIGELTVLVKNELELFSSRAPSGRRASSTSAETAPRDNIIAISASRRPREQVQEASVAVSGSGGTRSGLEAAVKRAMSNGQPEISLQPIVSIAQGAAIGFEVFAHVVAEDGEAFDVQKLPSSAAGLQGAFERWLVLGAADAILRQVVASAEGLPLHVPVTEALMSDSDGLSAVIEALRHSSKVSDGLVLSLPAAVVERNARFAEAVDLLAETGVHLAAEGISGNKEALEKMKRSGVSLIKLPADRLLGRVRPTKSSASAVKIIEAASALDLTVIAADVENDEDAVSLIDLGLNLMTGGRFSGPRRLRATAAA